MASNPQAVFNPCAPSHCATVGQKAAAGPMYESTAAGLFDLDEIDQRQFWLFTVTADAGANPRRGQPPTPPSRPPHTVSGIAVRLPQLRPPPPAARRRPPPVPPSAAPPGRLIAAWPVRLKGAKLASKTLRHQMSSHKTTKQLAPAVGGQHPFGRAKLDSAGRMQNSKPLEQIHSDQQLTLCVPS